MPLMDREQQFIRNRILSQKIAIQLVLRKEKGKRKKNTHTHKANEKCEEIGARRSNIRRPPSNPVNSSSIRGTLGIRKRL